MRKEFLLVVLAFGLVGCPPTPTPVNSGTATAVGDILKQIQTSVDNTNTTMKAFQAALDKQSGAKSQTEQFISDRITTATYFNLKNTTQNTYTGLVANELAPAAKLLPPPSPEAMQNAIDKLQLAFSVSEADKAKLTAQNQALELQAENLKGQVTQADAVVDTTRKALIDATGQTNAKVTELATAKGEIDIKAAETERANALAKEKAASAARVKVASIFMIIGGAVMVFGIVAAFLHTSAAFWPAMVGGGAAFAFGWLITYVEGLMDKPWFNPVAGCVLGTAALGLVWAGYHTYTQRKEAALNAKGFEATIGALQEAKNDDTRLGTNKFGAMKPHLQEWIVNDKGQPDTALQQHIDAKLVAMNLKNPTVVGPVAVTPVTAPLTPGPQG